MTVDRDELAGTRTDLAEDRTLLANERTFAGWVRTALASIAVGVGFNALFGAIQPPWIPRALATLFVLTGIFTVWSAERRACRVLNRLRAHEVSEPSRNNLRLIAIALTIGALGLIAGIWWLE